MTLRIAIGGFLHESHSFAPVPTTYADFLAGGESPPLARGAGLVAALQVIAFVRVWIPPTPAAEARIFQLGPMFILALSLAVLLWLFHLAGGPEPGDR